MCGIVAVLARTGAPPVDAAEVVRIRDAMAARGPDAAGLWRDAEGRAALGHRRLAIIDPSPAGDQPMASEDGRLRIVLNGEIYNFRRLRRELEDHGVVFRTRTDTEVLLHLYRHHGAAMVDRLRGMYAFALHDSERGGLLLARDPLGIKPLYLADDGRTLRAASQVRALLAGGGVASDPEPAGHVGFFLWGHVPEPYTLYRAIRALPAGATLWIGTDGARRLDRRFAVGPEIARLAAEAEDGRPPPDLAAALRESVADHYVADVPVAVFLSAGIDSAALVGLSRDVAPAGGVTALTLAFAESVGTPDDELPGAAATAVGYGAEHHAETVSGHAFRERLGALLEAMDQPSIDGVNTWLVSALAAQRGLKVALSGLGGDELFAGYPGFRDIPRAVRWLSWATRVPGVARGFRRLAAPVCRRLTSPKWASLLEFGGSWEGAYLLRRGLFMPWELPGMLDPDLVRAGWRELQPLARLAESRAGVPADGPIVATMELDWYLRGQLLRDADWAGMAHSVEVRTPYCDVELFRAVARHWVRGHRPGKSVLADSPSAPLPAALLHRPKTGFVVPLRDWLGEAGGARGLRGWAGLVHRALAA